MGNKRDISTQYKLLEIIGRGKFGTVHKGYNVDTKQVVAIKILNLDTDHEEVKDIQQEIQFLSSLKSVPNITHYYGSYLKGHKLWILMDYCAGGSVRTLLKPGPLQEKYISVITRELLIALQFIHEHNVIHRDIKAANILISKEGRVKLCDFGVAAQLSSTALKRTTMAGTPYWMAPEVITEGATYNVKADIWSTGITIYEMATGNPPYSDKDALRAMQYITQHEPPRLEGRQYGPLLKEIISICLEEKPDVRPSAEELLKTKFIKNGKGYPTTLIKEVIGKYLVWRDNRAENNSHEDSPNGNTDREPTNPNEVGRPINDNNINGDGLTELEMSSTVSIAETTTSQGEGENIKWDFDSLKSAEFISENNIHLHGEETSKFEDFAFEANMNTNREFTTSPYNRTFTIGNTMINNGISNNKHLINTATTNQLDSIINSQVELPSMREPPKALLELFMEDAEYTGTSNNNPRNNSNNVKQYNNGYPDYDQNPLADLNMKKVEKPVSISNPPQSEPSIPSRQQISSPLVSIEIPNMDVIENEIQEREKQRSRSATVNLMPNSHNNSNVTLNPSLPKVESFISDQPLPVRKPTMSMPHRTPSPARALEQLNTNLQSSPSKQSSPLHMKPLSVTISQPLLQPLNNSSNKNKLQINLANIPNNKSATSSGPQTAPITSSTNAELLDSSIRQRSQMRIQMPVPVSATVGSFSNVFKENNTRQGSEGTDVNQFGFEVNSSSIPLAMTPVTEKPFFPNNTTTPEKELSRGESNPSHGSKISSFTSTSNSQLSKPFERKSSMESSLKYQPFSLQSTASVDNHYFSNQHSDNDKNTSIESDDYEKADVTLTNENISSNENAVTGLGMTTLNDSNKAVSQKNISEQHNFLAQDKLHDILTNTYMDINIISGFGLSINGSENDDEKQTNEIYTAEIDNLLRNMGDVLDILITGLR